MPPSSRRSHPLAPKGPLNLLGWVCTAGVARVLLRLFYKVRLSDIPPLPAGPLIVAPNHRSYIDPVVVGALLDRRPIFMMHARYYDMPWLNPLYRMARCIPVENDADNRTALRLAMEVLRAGRVLVIFPEGTISPDGTLQEAQPGMAWLARKSGAPVYPAHLEGTREVLRKGSWCLRRASIRMRVARAPLRIHDFPAGRAGNEAFTAAVMGAITRLGRQGTGETGGDSGRPTASA